MFTAKWRWAALCCIIFLVGYAGMAFLTGYGVLSSETDNLPDGISKLELRSDNNLILLEVFLTEAATCKDVVTKLEIENLVVSGRTFAPVCRIVTKLHVQIRYKEMLST